MIQYFQLKIIVEVEQHRSWLTVADKRLAVEVMGHSLNQRRFELIKGSNMT